MNNLDLLVTCQSSPATLSFKVTDSPPLPSLFPLSFPLSFPPSSLPLPPLFPPSSLSPSLPHHLCMSPLTSPCIYACPR